MGVFTRTIQLVPGIGRALAGTAPAVGRLPTSAGGFLAGSIYGLSSEGNSQQTLGQMATSPWLFSVIDRIASSISSTDWVFTETTRGGVSAAIERHPAQALWDKPSPFTTRGELLEAGIQYFELLGEIPIVVLRGRSGQPAELQLVRPTRIFPVPSREDYLAGYVYRVGMETIPLAVEDVIFIRRPNPMNEHRGLGVVQSLLVDLGSEDAAARWMRSFFRNSAQPGGVVEIDGTLDESTFQRLRTQWAEHHQGVANAHRVAILERGHWKDAAFTQRDMQFEQLRKFSRDVILGAFGMPLSALGISETVNRANAEAGEVLFSRWVIRPRLERIAGELNEGLLPLFPGTEGMRFEFVDPTPADRLQDLAEGVQGYTAGVLTLNEARTRLGESAVAGGDVFKPLSTNPFEAIPPRMIQRELPSDRTAMLALRAGAFVEALTAAEVETRWERRLQSERDGLIAHLEGQSKTYWQKLELTDPEGWDWDWWTKWSSDVVAELSEMFTQALLSTFPDMPETNVQRLAGIYAETRGARLLKLDGDLSLAAATRQRVRELTAQTIEQGQGLKELIKQLRIDPGFSKERATLVARTESVTALGQGQKQAAVAQGRNEKRWITQGDALVRPTHQENARASWIPIADLFPDGEETISEFNCRCTVIYRTVDRDRTPTTLSVRRSCSACGKKNLMLNRDGPGLWCPRCKKAVSSF